MYLEPATLLTFVTACIVVAIVPGPSVTVIVANSLRYGTRAGLLNIAGTQAGVLVLLVILALGMEALTNTLAWVFDWLRLAGAGYLIWLGIKLLQADGTLGDAASRARLAGSFFWQGFIVVLSNPKLLLFFGAFLPQFVDPTGDSAFQSVMLGLVFMSVAATLDSFYALAAGRAGALFTRKNVRAVEVGGGSFLIGGGLWLALSR